MDTANGICSRLIDPTDTGMTIIVIAAAAIAALLIVMSIYQIWRVRPVDLTPTQPPSLPKATAVRR